MVRDTSAAIVSIPHRVAYDQIGITRSMTQKQNCASALFARRWLSPTSRKNSMIQIGNC